MARMSASRVIVADEVRDSADTVASLLEGNGITARAVYDGRDALAVAGMWQPDGAVLDLSLPGMSGFEVAREFRRLYGGRIRLVAYTGWSAASDRQRALEAGFDGFVVKPADPELLLQSLGRTTAALVQRSIEVRVAQVRRQIELGDSLLKRAEAYEQGRDSICDFLERALEACLKGVEELPARNIVRRDFEAQILRLMARIKSLQEESGEGRPQ
jgi:CheY-like chemotaxis protein